MLYFYILILNNNIAQFKVTINGSQNGLERYGG